MSHDLFQDVVDPSITVGNRRWYTVPASVLTHTIVALAVVVVPLVATTLLPSPGSAVVYVWAEPLPPQPPAPEVPATRPLTIASDAPNPNLAPVVAPIGFAPEPPPGLSMAAGVSTEVPGPMAGTGVSTLAAPPASAQPPGPQRVVQGGDIRAPRKIYDVRPVYPLVAQTAHVEGFVIIEATIGRDGVVVDARVIRSQPLLDRAALEAVRQWKFTPTTLNGVPVELVMKVTVNFTLH
jgi:protein TonB